MARLEQDVARLLQNAAPTKDWRSSAARVLAELAEFNSGAEGGAARLLSGRLFTVLDWEPIRQFDEMHKMEFVSERCARFSPASDAVRHILAAPSWAQEAAAYLRPGRSSVWSAGPFPKTMSISVIARAARLPAATGSQPTVLRALLTDERGAQQIKTFTVPLADDWTAELTQLPAGQRVTVLFDLVEPPGSSVAVWIQPRMAEPSALDAVSSPLEAPRTEFFVASQRVPARVSKLGPTVVRLQVMSRSQARTVAVHAEDRDYTVELRQDLFGDCFTAELLISLLDERRQDILLHPDGSDPVYVRASYPQLSLTAMNGTSAAPDEPLAATSSSVTAVQPDYSCLWSAAAPSVSLVQPLPPPSGGGWQRPFILSLTAGIDRTLIDTGNEPDWIWDGGVQLRTGGGPLRYRLTFEESRNMTRGVSLLSARQRIETRLPCGGRLAGEFGAWLQRDGGGLAMMQAGLTLDRTVKMGRIWSLLPRLGGFSRGLVGRATGSGEDGIDPRVWSSYKERHPRGAFYGIELRAEPRPGWRGWLDASQTLNAQFDKLDYTAWDAGAMFMQRRQGWRATLRYEGRRYGPEALSSGSRSRHLLRIGGGYGWWLPRGRRAELSTDVIRMFDPIEEWGLTVGLRLHFGARGSLDRFLMDEQPLRWEAERAAHHR